jgi:hypothetical protein
MILFDPSDNALITFDWSDVLPESVTVASVVHTVSSPLTKSTESNSTTTSTVKVTGAQHGGMYVIEGQATLSNGEVINRQFPIRGWNS